MSVPASGREESTRSRRFDASSETRTTRPRDPRAGARGVDERARSGPVVAADRKRAFLSAILLLVVALASGCREAKSPGPVRQPSAEREYRGIETLEWRALSGGSELIPHLNAQWPKVRRRAVTAYARVDRGQDPRPLLRRWSVEEDPGVRAGIVFALRGFDRASAIDVLESASEDEEATVRQAVAAALRVVPESRDLAEKLARDDEEPAVRQLAVLSLALSGQSTASFWSDRLKEEDHEEVRWALVAGASIEPGLASELAPILAGSIADRNFLAGAFALEALERIDGSLDDPEVLAATLDVAGDPSAFWPQREAAVRSLALRLARGGRGTEEDRRRIEARLLELATGEAFPSEPPVLRYRLARSLCAVRDPRGVARIRELISSSDPGLRVAVADGLADGLADGRADGPADGPGAASASELRGLLDELRTGGPTGVRAAAARLPGASDRPAAWALADPSARVRAAALEAAAPSPAEIESALADPSPLVRRAALERVAREELPLDAAALRAVAVDPHPSRWSSRVIAMDLFCARRPGDRRELLTAALASSPPVITRHALELRRRLGMQDVAIPLDVETRAGMVPGFPLIERDPVEERRRPRVVVGVEGKESFVVELFADEAPLHASSFLALARGGYYTGRTVAAIDAANGVRFHRDGDDRNPLVGQPLPAEDSVVPFARGSLVSVPLYRRDDERWDAVGEWQILLLPRPELSGTGTCWGRVYIGMPVIDRLAPGDRIVSIEVVD